MIARRILAVLSATLLLAGCVSSMLARSVVAPPNKSGIKPLFADGDILKRAPDAFAATWTVAGGPAARADRGGLHRARRLWIHLRPADGLPGRQGPEDPEVHGTLAIGGRKAAVHAAAARHHRAAARLFAGPELRDALGRTLAQAGFRCVVFDLRGHGESTGDHISFGAFESRDVSQLLDDLERRGWDVSRVGLFGLSYGASVALLAAGRDTRVASVVAFEPSRVPRPQCRSSCERRLPSRARGISDEQFARAHLKEAEIAGFDWADADIPAALKRTQAPVLFFHGEQDHWLSPEHSRALLSVAPAGSRLELAPLDNHLSLPLHFEKFAPAVIDWFDAGLH